MTTSHTAHANIAMTKHGRLIHLDENGEREFGPRAQAAVRYASVALLPAFAMLAILIATGLMPPAPWSPMGHSERIVDEPTSPVLPDDWRELLPANPEGPTMEWPEPGTSV